MKSASPIGTDRGGGCSVSINAYLTLPRLAQVAQSSSSGHPTGIRFEYSWSNNFPDSSPTPSRRCNAGRNHNITTECDPNGRWTRHNSSSGYGSGDTPPVVAATLTVSHPATGTSFASGETGRRVTQPYERRCRSTCSITLQACHEGLAQQTVPETGNYPLHPHHFRRCSEGETWNSHTKVPQVVVPPPPVQLPAATVPETTVSPAVSATPVDKVNSFSTIMWKGC